MKGSRYLPLLTPPRPAARTTRVSAAGGRASSPPQRAGEEQRGAWRASHICHERVRPNIGPAEARREPGTGRRDSTPGRTGADFFLVKFRKYSFELQVVGELSGIS